MLHSTATEAQPGIALRADTYLTDESSLYRVLDTTRSVRPMVMVEDCVSLEMILIDVRSISRLRQVKAALTPN